MIWTEGVLEHVNQAQVLREELERNEKNPFLKQMDKKNGFPRGGTQGNDWSRQLEGPSSNRTLWLEQDWRDPSFLKVH